VHAEQKFDEHIKRGQLTMKQKLTATPDQLEELQQGEQATAMADQP
jgi:hypothetical protein